MTNPLLPASKITIYGTDYLLRFDFEAVAEAEEIVNRPLVTGLSMDDVYRPKVSLVRAMFFAAAHRDQPSLTLEAAKALITRENLNDVWMKVIEAWTAQNPTPDEQDSPTADPIPAQR